MTVHQSMVSHTVWPVKQDAVVEGWMCTEQSPTVRVTNVSTVASLACDIAQGMAVLHGRGIRHGVCPHSLRPCLFPKYTLALSMMWVRNRAPLHSRGNCFYMSASLQLPGLSVQLDSIRKMECNLSFCLQDLCSGNILLQSNLHTPHGYSAKIADFGLSREDNMKARLSRNDGMGTIAYLPPEAFAEGKVSKVGHATIFWVLVIAWAMHEPSYWGLLACNPFTTSPNPITCDSLQLSIEVTYAVNRHSAVCFSVICVDGGVSTVVCNDAIMCGSVSLITHAFVLVGF